MTTNMERPRSFDDAAAAVLTPEEQSELDGASTQEAVDVEEPEAPAPTQGDAPSWAIVPEGFKFPDGRIVAFMLFKAAWTDTPKKGDRQCILWNLSVGDEKNAIQRTRGDAMRMLSEMSKGMIRSVDGLPASWIVKIGAAGAAGSVETFWNDIGAKCRQQIVNYYMRTHTMPEEEKLDFFANCIAVRTAG